MSAPSGGASSAPQCACSNISIMQLFHELKQQFPGVPDHVVSNTISSHCHDRTACQSKLQCEAKKYISHLYPSSSLAGNKKEIKDVLCPQQCPNQLIIDSEANKPKSIEISTIRPQKAICTYTKLDENQNENIVKEEEIIDDEEYSSGSLDDEEDSSGSLDDKESIKNNIIKKDLIRKENKNRNVIKTFQILKSNKVTSDLNKKLFHENKQDKNLHDTGDNIINKDNKIKRPTTLGFSTEPQFTGFNVNKTHKESLSAPATFPDTSQKIQNKVNDNNNTCKCQHKCCDKSTQERNDPQSANESFPLNLSVNLNCRMDVRPGVNRTHHNQYQEPWRGSYSNPTNITSVNLTVCTPTISEDNRNTSFNHPADSRQRGFEGHVQITVSPASSHPPFRGPSTNVPQSRSYFPSSQNMMPEPSSPIDDLLHRQRERLQRLENALKEEKSRLNLVQREVDLLREPAPISSSRLWPDVQFLRNLCQKLSSQLDGMTDGEFYDNIYTGQRQTGISSHHHRHQHHHQQQQQRHVEEPDTSWSCHMCTFRNNGLLNKCEECGMPRIILGTEASANSSRPIRSAPPPPPPPVRPLRFSRSAPPPPPTSPQPASLHSPHTPQVNIQHNSLQLTPTSPTGSLNTVETVEEPTHVETVITALDNQALNTDSEPLAS